jgi:LPS O-antigen subunit length determinant protein (WzzB/FepE family)
MEKPLLQDAPVQQSYANNAGFSSDDEIDLFELLGKIIAGWKAIILFILVFFIAAVFYLRNATPIYATYYQVTPAASSSGSISGKLGNLGGIAALAGVSLSGQGGAASPFDLYLEYIKSRALADKLAQDPFIMQGFFTDQWDRQAKQWREPKGMLITIKTSVKGLVGQSEKSWQPPNSEDLQKVLEKQVNVLKPGTKGPDIYKISLNHPNPAFARYVLKRVNELADAKVRSESLTRATRYADYLSRRLSSVVIAELRKDLSDALAEQEKSIMLASSDSSYAALLVSGIYSDSMAVSPKYIPVLAIALVLGFFMGCLYALIDFKAFFKRLSTKREAAA